MRLCEECKRSLRRKAVFYDRDFMWVIVVGHVVVVGVSIVLLLFCQIVFWINVQGYTQVTPDTSVESVVGKHAFLFTNDFRVATNLTGQVQLPCNKGYSHCNYCAAPIVLQPFINYTDNLFIGDSQYPIIFFAVCSAGSDMCLTAIAKQKECFLRWEQSDIHGGLLEVSHHDYAAAISDSIQRYSLLVTNRTVAVVWENPYQVYATALDIMIGVLLGGNLFLVFCIVLSRVVCFIRRRRDYAMINEDD
jgi:hypothetical protein